MRRGVDDSWQRSRPAPARLLPDYLTIGAQKSGTTALDLATAGHPRACSSTVKQAHHLFHLLRPRHGRAALCEVRLIALPRNPVARAWSICQYGRAKGCEKAAQELVLAPEFEARLLCGEVERILADPCYFPNVHIPLAYFARGRYAGQIGRWLEYFRFPNQRLDELLAEPFSARWTRP